MSGQSLKDRLALYPYQADGRKPAAFPKNPFPRQRLTRPSVSVVRNAIQRFLSSGRSDHSKNALLIAYIIDYCETNKIPYVLNAAPKYGYSIERSPEMERLINLKGEK